MLVCGVEEPVQRNESLYQLDVKTGKLTYSELSNVPVNRCSFLPLGDPIQASQELANLIMVIASQLHLPAVWVSSWFNHIRDGSQARVRLLLSKKRKDGWHISDNGDITVATKAIDFPLLKGWLPEGYSWRDGGIMIMIDGSVGISEFTDENNKPSMILLAKTGAMAPSKEFLLWLFIRHQSIIYSKRDDFGREGLVMVGAHRLNIEEVSKVIDFQEIYYDKVADRVWRQPPWV
jgi:hypothetical protein